MKSFKFVIVVVCWALVRGEPASSGRNFVFGIPVDGGGSTPPESSSLTCGDATSDAEATFTNPNFPDGEISALTGCQFKIKHFNKNICQIRLDFNELVLSQPNNEGVCDSGFLQVTGGGSSYSSYVPIICGDNTGQHVYMDVSPQDSDSLIRVDTSRAGGKWSINVLQIECMSLDRAPSGCLQYFNTTASTIRSFNFNPASTASSATCQLANQGYGVCINSQPGYCSVTYRQAPGSAFSLSGDPGGLAPGLPAPAIVDMYCTTDFLFVPNGHIEDTTNVFPISAYADRFCGLSFPGVTSFIPPFNIFMVTDGDESSSGDVNNQGFELIYRMNAC